MATREELEALAIELDDIANNLHSTNAPRGRQLQYCATRIKRLAAGNSTKMRVSQWLKNTRDTHKAPETPGDPMVAYIAGALVSLHMQTQRSSQMQLVPFETRYQNAQDEAIKLAEEIEARCQ